MKDEIRDLLAEGLTIGEIAESLHVSRAAVLDHIPGRRRGRPRKRVALPRVEPEFTKAVLAQIVIHHCVHKNMNPASVSERLGIPENFVRDVVAQYATREHVSMYGRTA